MTILPGVAAGRLTHRIDIRRKENQQDAAGQPIATWVDAVANIPCRVEATTGGERWRGFAIQASVGWVVEMRHLGTVASAMQVKWQGKTLEIESVIDPEGNGIRELLFCAEAA